MTKTLLIICFEFWTLVIRYCFEIRTSCFGFIIQKTRGELPLLFCTQWCRRGDLNPHGDYPPPPQDGVSTNSTTSAVFRPFWVLRLCSLNGNTPALQYGNTSLFLRFGYLWLNRNIWRFRRSGWSRSFLDQRGCPFCRGKSQKKRCDHKNHRSDRRQF